MDSLGLDQACLGAGTWFGMPDHAGPLHLPWFMVVSCLHAQQVEVLANLKPLSSSDAVCLSPSIRCLQRSAALP